VRSFRRILLVLLALGIVAALFVAFAILFPFQAYSGEVFVDIHRGASTPEMAAQLAEAGVLRSGWPFLLLRAIRPRTVLQAGEYRFDRPLSPWDVYRKLASGDIYYHTVTVPEGFNIYETAAAVDRTGIISGQVFLQAARQGQRIADLASGVQTLEGFLYPDTYLFSRHTTAEDLAGQMLTRFRQVWKEVLAGRPAAPPVLETVTLASLIEKETSVGSERRVVSSVFHNRLRLGMPLQCDPTVIYALQLLDRYRGEIYRDDLALPSPYNTYVRAGLPPGPIANPGRASLEAALDPAATEYLYFVADAQGGHIFSATLDRHSEAVARYRRSTAANSRKTPAKTSPKPKNAGSR
jgi:UPF0755 protein